MAEIVMVQVQCSVQLQRAAQRNPQAQFLFLSLQFVCLSMVLRYPGYLHVRAALISPLPSSFKTFLPFSPALPSFVFHFCCPKSSVSVGGDTPPR